MKLIWDFRGPDASRIAAHFCGHLGESLSEDEPYEVGTRESSPSHCIAFLVVPEAAMRPMRDRFKPHRGEWVES